LALAEIATKQPGASDSARLPLAKSATIPCSDGLTWASPGED